MENIRLPHSNLSNTAKSLCLINNGFLNFMIGMTYVTMGVLNGAIADSIGSTDGYITFIAGISIAITNFSGFIGENVLNQIGMKYLTIVSTLLKCISTCMLSTVNDGVSFAGWTTVLGLSNGLISTTSVSTLGLIFSDHLSNAIGFVTLLLMVGAATPPAIQVCLENYGWRGALLVTGAIHLHGLVTATSLDSSIGRRKDIPYTEIGISEEEKTFLDKIGERLQLQVFRDIKANGLFVVAVCTCFNGVVFYLSLIPYAISISIEPMHASFLKTLVGMGCVVARFLQCIVPQTAKTSAMLLFTQIIDVIALTVLIFSNQYTALAITSFTHGASFGMQACLILFLAIKAVDAEYAGGAIAWGTAFSGLGEFSAGLLGFFNSDVDLLFCFQTSTILQAFALIPSCVILIGFHSEE